MDAKGLYPWIFSHFGYILDEIEQIRPVLGQFGHIKTFGFH